MSRCVLKRFDGSLTELKDKLAPLDLDGEWLKEPNGVWKFKCKDGAGFHWSSTKGTLWFDGPSPQKEILKSMIEGALNH
jgi:hypothetical protein